MITKIMSGGQPGAAHAALNVACKTRYPLENHANYVVISILSLINPLVIAAFLALDSTLSI